MQKHKITVLILNYNSWQSTLEYVIRLKEQMDILLFTLIVDNCSPDDSFLKLKDNFEGVNDVEVIKTEFNGGYAYGNNYGLKYLSDRGDLKNTFVAISNNDIDFNNKFLFRQLINNYYRCKNIAFISPAMYINGEISCNYAWRIPNIKYDIKTVLELNTDRDNKEVYYDIPKDIEKNSLLKVECLPGSLFMGKLNTFEAIDYFDDRTFLFVEEQILAKKISKLGLSNYVALGIKFNHSESTVIDNEMDNITKVSHLFKSRMIYYRYYSEEKRWKISFLAAVQALYLIARKAKRKVFFL